MLFHYIIGKEAVSRLEENLESLIEMMQEEEVTLYEQGYTTEAEKEAFIRKLYKKHSPSGYALLTKEEVEELTKLGLN